MIRAEVIDVDTSHYVYDTGLSFGAEFGHKILELALTKPHFFKKRHNYNTGKSFKDLARLIGLEKTLELRRRREQMESLSGGSLINFEQFFFPQDLGDELVSQAPQWVQTLSPNEPSPMLQISSGGDYLGTHKGHKRRASLFMLLQGDGQETRWYRNEEDFEVIDPLRIPDHDKIEHVVTAVMEPWRWYIFNHFEWHSVHNFASGSIRVNMGLDFDNVSAPDLVSALQKQAQKHYFKVRPVRIRGGNKTSVAI